MTATAEPAATPAADPPPARGSRISLILRAAIVVSYAGIVVLRPSLPHNTAFVDPLLAAVSFGALLSMGRQGSPATVAAVKALPWIWLIIVGSLVGLATVGMAFWGVSDLLVGLFAFLTFFAFWHLVYLHHMERYAVWGTAVGLAVTTFTVASSNRLRSRGLFAQPNYPAHYAVLAAIVLVYACRHRWAKALAIIALLIIIKDSGSFGSIAMVLAALAVLGWRAMTRASAVLAVALAVLFCAGLFVVSNYVTTGSPGFSTKIPTVNGTGISQSRLNKSQGERYQLWSQDIQVWLRQPFGVGPSGVVNRHLAFLEGDPLQVHDDAFSYLVERGPIGLIGFVGLWVVLWRCAKRRGMARLMILVILLSSVYRQVMHYRHVWLLLALAFVFDSRRPDEADTEPEIETVASWPEAGTDLGEPGSDPAPPVVPPPGVHPVWRVAPDGPATGSR